MPKSWRRGPSVEQDGVCRWRLRDLRDWILNRIGVPYTPEGVRGLIHRSGFQNLTPRPIHPKENPVAQEIFRREFGTLAMKAALAGVATEKVEIGFQDKARAGQEGMLSRVWGPVGTRPRTVMALLSFSPPPVRFLVPPSATSVTRPILTR